MPYTSTNYRDELSAVFVRHWPKILSCTSFRKGSLYLPSRSTSSQSDGIRLGQLKVPTTRKKFLSQRVLYPKMVLLDLRLRDKMHYSVLWLALLVNLVVFEDKPSTGGFSAVFVANSRTALTWRSRPGRQAARSAFIPQTITELKSVNSHDLSHHITENRYEWKPRLLPRQMLLPVCKTPRFHSILLCLRLKASSKLH